MEKSEFYGHGGVNHYYGADYDFDTFSQTRFGQGFYDVPHLGHGGCQ